MERAGASAILAAAILALGAPARAAAPPEGKLEVRPPRIPIDLLFDGQDLEVNVEVPEGWEAAVRLTGAREDLKLKRKGRRGGVLWMNVGEVDFHDVPVVYQLVTSRPLADLAGEAALLDASLGFESLVPPGRPGAELRQDLVALKRRDGLYGIAEGRLALRGPQAGWRQGKGSLHLPSCAPAGEYAVELLGARDGQIVTLARATVPVEYAGIVASLRTLALDRGLAYGLLAVVVAIVAGLATGVIFQSRSGKGH